MGVGVGGSLPPQSGFRACTDGRGLGEPRESLALLNCHRRDDKVRCGF